MNFMILSLLVLLASLVVVFSQQELLAKKAKFKAKKSNQYLNIYAYNPADADCSGPVGVAYSINMQGCWYGGGDCGGRRLTEKKLDAVAPNTILEKVFHGGLDSANAKKKLSAYDGPYVGYTNSISVLTLSAPYATAKAQMDMYAAPFVAKYNTSSCDATGFLGTEYVYGEGPLPLNICVPNFAGDGSPNVMFTVSEGASPPDYGSSDFIAISMFNKAIGQSTCSAGVPNDNPDSLSFNMFEYEPIGTCNYLYKKYAHNNATGELTYQAYNNYACAGSPVGNGSIERAGSGCVDGGNSVLSFFGECGWVRTDVRKPQPAGTTAKKSAKRAAQLRL